VKVADITDSLVKGIEGSGCGHAQVGFGFGEGHLHGVRIGRILAQARNERLDAPFAERGACLETVSPPCPPPQGGILALIGVSSINTRLPGRRRMRGCPG